MRRASRLLATAAMLPVVAALSLLGAGAARAANSVPYTDPSADGYIGLCNKAGQQITSGNINTTPLAWRAVSSTAAIAPYNEAGRTATLLAYQPRQGLLPGEWSGEEITSSSRYSNPAHPMVAATDGDYSLAYFTSDFHPAWDGLVQLRIYLGAPDTQAESVKYPVLDLQVTGNTWKAVDGGPVNCHSGTSESIETILLPQSTPTPTAGDASTGTVGASPTGSSSPAANGGSASTAPGGVSPTSTALAAASSSSASSHHTLAIVLIAVIVLLAIASYVFTRQRRLASASAPPPSSEGPSGKGQ